jgi:hypothetical protein
MRQRIRSALDEEWRVGTIRHYPLLKMLEFAFESDFPTDPQTRNATPDLRGVPCLTDAVSGAFTIIASNDSERELKRIFPTLDPQTAFWCGIATAIVQSRENRSSAKEILSFLKERSGDRLLPTEQLLLKSIEEKLR